MASWLEECDETNDYITGNYKQARKHQITLQIPKHKMYVHKRAKYMKNYWLTGRWRRRWRRWTWTTPMTTRCWPSLSEGVAYFKFRIRTHLYQVRKRLVGANYHGNWRPWCWDWHNRQSEFIQIPKIVFTFILKYWKPISGVTGALLLYHLAKHPDKQEILYQVCSQWASIIV